MSSEATGRSAPGALEIPEGMSARDFNSHPVRALIREAAYGGTRALPSKAALDALELPPTDREKVAEAARAAADLHEEGDRQAGWTEGDRRAAEIIDALPDEFRDPSYLEAPTPEVTDPRELAARVRN